MYQKEYSKRRILLEYKQLKDNAPSGIYIVPSLNPMKSCDPLPFIDDDSTTVPILMDDVRDNTSVDTRNSLKDEHDHGLNVFYGVIFVRRGMYRNAIFKFRISLPQGYNSFQTYPRVHFFSQVMNPYVNDTPTKFITNKKKKESDCEYYELDLRSDTLIGPQWDPRKHSLVSVALCIKKIFYLTKFDPPRANPENQGAQEKQSCFGNYNAWLLWKIDVKGFEKNVFECADESQRHVKDDEESSIKFANKDHGGYQALREYLKKAATSKRSSIYENKARVQAFQEYSKISQSSYKLTRNEILEAVEKARTFCFLRKQKKESKSKIPRGPSKIMPNLSITPDLNWFSRFSGSILTTE